MEWAKKKIGEWSKPGVASTCESVAVADPGGPAPLLFLEQIEAWRASEVNQV